MRRADDLGAELRRTIGEPMAGPPDQAFLAGLAGVRRRVHERRVAMLGVLFLVAGGAVLFAAIPRQGEVPEPIADIARREAPVALIDDPEAALLLEAARLRLSGYGDPAVAPRKLRELIRRYPASRAAARAVAMLRDLEGSER